MTIEPGKNGSKGDNGRIGNETRKQPSEQIVYAAPVTS
jgi:hypothetical protein